MAVRLIVVPALGGFFVFVLAILLPTHVEQAVQAPVVVPVHTDLPPSAPPAIVRAAPDPASDGAASDNAAAAIAALVPLAGRVLDATKTGLGYAGSGLGIAYLPSGSPPSAAPPPGLPSQAMLPPAAAAPPGIDLNGLAAAIADYRKGDLAGGDAIAKTRSEALARTMLEWVALRTHPREAGWQRIVAFLGAHADWPSAPWLRRRAEEALYFDKAEPSTVTAFFGDSRPTSPAGELALARALLSDGRSADAAALVRDTWRTDDLSASLEVAILKEFGSLLTGADHKYRADRFLYEGSPAAALRAAERAGPDALVLARARAAVINGSAAAPALLNAVPAALKQDPGYLFSLAQNLRKANRFADAATALSMAPRDPALLIDGDAWWAERRLVARKLLDLGDAQTAYRLCAEHSAASAEAKVEAEFHAGWIALRFLDDPATAAKHFARAATFAETPAQVARAAYWQARAAEAAGKAGDAARLYDNAAAFPTTYYGQLAHAKRARTEPLIRQAAKVAVGDERHEAVRVVELLYALGAADLAFPLVVDGVQRLPDEAQVAALGAITAAYRDARATLLIGKLAANRGFALDDLAFPIFGIPAFEPAANSADLPMVYAIARQESAFDPSVVSSAGAKGLMQLLSSTARRTAQRAGIPYDESRLTKDPAFNAKLGAAFLGAVLDDQRGSYILSFAAYNAGGRRVQEWIDAYGDPRDPDIDPVDWIELIPIAETRHYVQLVMENLEIYRLRFGERTALLIESDLRRTRSGT